MRTRRDKRATRSFILPTVGEREEKELGDIARDLKEVLGVRSQLRACH
jgi:hypothetical protein